MKNQKYNAGSIHITELQENSQDNDELFDTINLNCGHYKQLY
jgi:hypothetical protein